MIKNVRREYVVYLSCSLFCLCVLFTSCLIFAVAPFLQKNAACCHIRPLFFHTKQHLCDVTLHHVILDHKLDQHFTLKKKKKIERERERGDKNPTSAGMTGG